MLSPYCEPINPIRSPVDVVGFVRLEIMAEKTPVDPAASSPAEAAPAPVQALRVKFGLGLGALTVIGVIAAAAWYTNTAPLSPVTLGEIPASQAEDPQCTEFIAALPERIGDLRLAPLADPVPAGSAAYKTADGQQVTVRCGVNTPLQYTELASTSTRQDITWLPVFEGVGEQTIASVYSLGHAVTVAVTGPVDADRDEGLAFDVVDGLGEAMTAAIETADTPPLPLPLSTLAAPDAEAQSCTDLLAAVDERFTVENPEYEAAEVTPLPGLRAFVAADAEPVIVRCGLEQPADYEAGVRLQVVNEVTWLEAASGTGEQAQQPGYFTVDRPVTIGVVQSPAAGSAPLTSLSAIIADTLESTGN